MIKGKFLLAAAALTLSLGACDSAREHARDVTAATDGDKLTVGAVQRGIKIGMSSAAVVSVLGSPNMVTTDDKRRENWVYDKVSTLKTVSADAAGITWWAGVDGASSTTQRTLTIIIKFDENNLVRDYAYRTSSF